MNNRRFIYVLFAFCIFSCSVKNNNEQFLVGTFHIANSTGVINDGNEEYLYPSRTFCTVNQTSSELFSLSFCFEWRLSSIRVDIEDINFSEDNAKFLIKQGAYKATISIGKSEPALWECEVSGYLPQRIVGLSESHLEIKGLFQEEWIGFTILAMSDAENFAYDSVNSPMPEWELIGYDLIVNESDMNAKICLLSDSEEFLDMKIGAHESMKLCVYEPYSPAFHLTPSICRSIVVTDFESGKDLPFGLQKEGEERCDQFIDGVFWQRTVPLRVYHIYK